MRAGGMRLGVNIDHVATLRNARGGRHPDPLRAALATVEAGADGITVHLREDRRHIRDADVRTLRERLTVPLNLEMAVTPEMVAFACALAPAAVCLVPERREEVTTEGGLDVAANAGAVAEAASRLRSAGCRVSLFIDPDARQVEAAKAAGAAAVELHTGAFCEAPDRGRELARLGAAASFAQALDLECHAGHGLDYETAGIVAGLPEVIELNIGHFLVGEALFHGFAPVITTMRAAIERGRAAAQARRQAGARGSGL